MPYLKTPLSQPLWRVLLAALVLVGLIGWIDHATDKELSFFVFYALPLALVVWKTDWRLGIAFAFLCTVIWYLAQIESAPYQTGFGFALAAASRLFYFVALVVAVAAIKSRRKHDRVRIERLERAQKLERDILWASEREQQRIGRDLHDSLGPHLAAIGYAASFLANDLRQRDQPEAGKAEQIRELLDDAISLVRDLSRGIAPVQLDGPGLSIALEDLASSVTSLTGIPVSFNEIGDTLVVDPETGMHLYRISQEAVNNALKHGGASKVSVVFSKIENALHLAISDDGKGMAPSPDSRRGMGLQSMRYRARALGGDLKIESTPSEGTVVSCEIPVRLSLLEMPAP